VSGHISSKYLVLSALLTDDTINKTENEKEKQREIE
jgi:hypothetical protein